MIRHSETHALFFFISKLGQVQDPVLKNGLGLGLHNSLRLTYTVICIQGGKTPGFGWVQLALKSARASLHALPNFEASEVDKNFHLCLRFCLFHKHLHTVISWKKSNMFFLKINRFENLVSRSFRIQFSRETDKGKLPNFVQDKILPFVQIKGASLLRNEWTLIYS